MYLQVECALVLEIFIKQFFVRLRGMRHGLLLRCLLAVVGQLHHRILANGSPILGQRVNQLVILLRATEQLDLSLCVPVIAQLHLKAVLRQELLGDELTVLHVDEGVRAELHVLYVLVQFSLHRNVLKEAAIRQGEELLETPVD